MNFEKFIKKLVSGKRSSITFGKVTDDGSSLIGGPITFSGKSLFYYENFGASFIELKQKQGELTRGFHIRRGFMADHAEITVADGSETKSYTILTIFEPGSWKNNICLAVIDYDLDPKGYLTKNARSLNAEIFSYKELEKIGITMFSFRLHQ